MQTPAPRRIEAALAAEARSGADAGQIAARVVAACREVDAALAPVIGARGVAALFQRSVHLAAEAVPWLAGGGGAGPTGIDLPALESLLSARDAADAAVGGGRLLQQFDDLLASLIGPALTARLLRSVWDRLASPSSASETRP